MAILNNQERIMNILSNSIILSVFLSGLLYASEDVACKTLEKTVETTIQQVLQGLQENSLPLGEAYMGYGFVSLCVPIEQLYFIKTGKMLHCLSCEDRVIVAREYLGNENYDLLRSEVLLYMENNKSLKKATGLSFLAYHLFDQETVSHLAKNYFELDEYNQRAMMGAMGAVGDRRVKFLLDTRLSALRIDVSLLSSKQIPAILWSMRYSKYPLFIERIDTLDYDRHPLVLLEKIKYLIPTVQEKEYVFEAVKRCANEVSQGPYNYMLYNWAMAVLEKRYDQKIHADKYFNGCDDLISDLNKLVGVDIYAERAAHMLALFKIKGIVQDEGKGKRVIAPR